MPVFHAHCTVFHSDFRLWRDPRSGEIGGSDSHEQKRRQPAARGAIQGHGFNSPRVTQSAHPRSSRRFEKRRNQSFVVEDEGVPAQL